MKNIFLITFSSILKILNNEKIMEVFFSTTKNKFKSDLKKYFYHEIVKIRFFSFFFAKNINNK